MSSINNLIIVGSEITSFYNRVLFVVGSNPTISRMANIAQLVERKFFLVVSISDYYVDWIIDKLDVITQYKLYK